MWPALSDHTLTCVTEHHTHTNPLDPASFSQLISTTSGHTVHAQAILNTMWFACPSTFTHLVLVIIKIVWLPCFQPRLLNTAYSCLKYRLKYHSLPLLSAHKIILSEHESDSAEVIFMILVPNQKKHLEGWSCVLLNLKPHRDRENDGGRVGFSWAFLEIKKTTTKKIFNRLDS